ncbi:hypothetical protein ABPG75_007567 [Micractinium tetrahymenae]
MKLLALTLLALVASASAASYPYGPKCFDHSVHKFYDVGAMGGFAQRAFLISHKRVMKELRKEPGLSDCRTVDYHLDAGCFEPLMRVGTANIVGEYAFKYDVVLRCGKDWADCHIKATTVMTRDKKQLAEGEPKIKCN